ncbi:MAG: hypothetical protein ACK4ON_03210 [Bacteroidia bacterium]
MKTSKIIIALAVISATVFVSCKKKKKAPLEECVAASIEYKNMIDNISYQQSSYGNTELEVYKNMPTSISIPSGSTIRINAAWNFENYKDSDADVSKILVIVDYGNGAKECEMPKNSDAPGVCIPGYKSGNVKVRFVLNNGEEATVGPFSFTINSDNKVLTDKEIESYQSVSESRRLLASDNDSEKQGLRYLFAPNHFEGLYGGFGLYKALLSNSFNSTNDEFMAYFGLFCLTNRGLSANQLKIVASDKISSNNLYPELTQKYGCSLGDFNARFEFWDAAVDTNLVDPFHTFVNSLGLKNYSNLDTLSLSNPQSELVLNLDKPYFKFVTSYGKKGVGRLKTWQNNAATIEFIMQR